MFLNFKREFDKGMNIVEESLSSYQYPLLCKSLTLKGPNRIKTRIVAMDVGKMKAVKEMPPKSEIKKKKEDFNVEEVENKKEKKFSKIKTNDDIEKMSIDDLQSYVKGIHKIIKQIEGYANDYIKYNKGYTVKEFEVNDKYVTDLCNKNEK